MKLVAGLDIETTGLDWKDGHKIIEIALCIRDLDTGSKVKDIVRRFNPRRTIPESAYKIHKISLEELVSEPLFSDFCEPLVNFLGRCTCLVAHNGIDFDIPFIDHELKQNGFEIPEIPVIDTMVNGRWATEDGKMPSLKELAFACGFDYDLSKAHGALYDTDLMMQCFFYARDKYGFFI